MKQIVLKQGKAININVPIPVVSDNEILVNIKYSCISQGTDLMGVKNTGMSAFERITTKAKNKKNLIQDIISEINEKGISSILKKIEKNVKPNKNYFAVGYSAAGIVIATGNNVKDINVGDRVACAGAGLANHAEFVSVPRNLTMKVPKELSLAEASTVTLGGIALQGVRRGDFKLGEIVVVQGLGMLGILTVQMLIKSGCRVIAIDINNRRCEIAKRLGAEFIFNPLTDKDYIEKTKIISNGNGVDGVIFTAATNDPSVISDSFQMCKRKGKVVLVGVAGNTIDRNDLYPNELDYLVSTSYGPGRYDPNYEEKSIDYPYAYVRWTENRNMEEYLRLISVKKININDLIDKVYESKDAEKAYREISTIKDKPLIALFKFPEQVEQDTKQINKAYIKETDQKILNVALVGVGNFTKAMHIPNLLSLKDKYKLHAICDKNPLVAKEISELHNCKYATSNIDDILGDENIDLVMICTRHNIHAELAIKSLNAGKHTFVEKPAAINEEQLYLLSEAIKKSNSIYMVGFNRRFAPHVKIIKEKIKKRVNPMVLSYRMNAGYIPLDHWVHSEEGAGRIIGEGCHIIDLFNFMTDANILSVSSSSIKPITKAISASDNVTVNIEYDDGSIANLIYTAIGNTNYPKEHLEVYCDQNIYNMTDYLDLSAFGNENLKTTLKKQDKGHLQELIELYEGIQNKKHPISIESIEQTTKASFLI